MLHQCLPTSFGSIRLMVWEEMSFEEFQAGRHGSHLGYQNGTILAILNLYVAPMPPIKFQLNLTYCLGGDAIWRISRWPLWRPSWAHFSNSESPCCHNASHYVSAQSNLWFWRRCRKCEKLMTDDGRTYDKWQTTGHGIRWPGAKLQVS